LAGSIHVSTRVQSNEDVIEQTKYVSEVLAEVISTLANHFSQIKYYNVIGNHGRTGNKHDVGIKENYEYLIPWFLEARLREFDNVEIITDQDGYVTTKIFNDDIVLVHGNYDRVDQCVTRLPQVLGYVPDYIMGGHVHHNYEKEYGKTTVIVNGSLIGADDYAMQGRYGAKPSQKFMVFDELDGLECTYVIKLK
jgi:DNA repair exonuclease SbcCD nuclease subunit